MLASHPHRLDRCIRRGACLYRGAWLLAPRPVNRLVSELTVYSEQWPLPDTLTLQLPGPLTSSRMLTSQEVCAAAHLAVLYIHTILGQKVFPACQLSPTKEPSHNSLHSTSHNVLRYVAIH